MLIRKAFLSDLDGVAAVYEAAHEAESHGLTTTGWQRDIYPTRATAAAALNRDDLFVLTADGRICGTAVINQLQVDVYAGASWEYDADDNSVCVLHTLVISPDVRGKGFGAQFVKFYENYARENRWMELRMDTNARNASARKMYAKLGYTEIGIVPTVFNGIPGVDLVLLEKHLF